MRLNVIAFILPCSSQPVSDTTDDGTKRSRATRGTSELHLRPGAWLALPLALAKMPLRRMVGAAHRRLHLVKVQPWSGANKNMLKDGQFLPATCTELMA